MKINLNDYKKIFFVGIGGISMSGLAMLLKSEAREVLGSNIEKTHITKKLIKNGIKVYHHHKAKNVYGCDLVVFSGAIPKDNPEVRFAVENNIPTIERSYLLRLISDEYENVIAISGTHGKTTTTSMISYIFLISGLKPTIHIGGEFDYIGGNVLKGDKKYFITEACEFRDSFLQLSPTVSVISNIEPEHLDYFLNFDREKKSFNKFIENTLDKCFICARYKNLILDKSKAIFYGDNEKTDRKKTQSNMSSCKENTIELKTNKKQNNDLKDKISENENLSLYAKNIKLGVDGKYSFDCYQNKTFIGNFKINVFGKHNIENALATISVCLHFGIEYKLIYLGLKTFNNAHRRFEFIGTYKNCQVIHDYAHHPTEILNSIKTCKEVFNKKVVCVFQPHTFSRTKTLIENFGKCFDGLDSLFILKTYSAREPYDYSGSADCLKEKLLKSNPNYLIHGVYTKKQFVREIKNYNFNDCVFLFLGAGDIESLPKKIIKKKNLYN